MHPVRRDIGQRHQDERAFMGARVRQHRVRRRAHDGVQIDQVDVEGLERILKQAFS